MPFDGFMTSAIVHELSECIISAKIEKIYVPTPDEMVLLLHTKNGEKRLSLSASSSTPKVNITKQTKENPAVPSAFCMQMRKHLVSCKVCEVSQPEFERVIKISLDGVDELGFATKKHIYAEIIGKLSNVIITDSEGKIINAIKTVDFSTSTKRQLLPGMIYSLPPSQDKTNPFLETKDGFSKKIALCEKPLDSFFMSYRGFSPLIARELVYLLNYDGKIACECDAKAVWDVFSDFIKKAESGEFVPTIIYEDEKPVDYYVCDILQYGTNRKSSRLESFGQLIDAFYGQREKSERIRQRTLDIFKLLTNAETRLKKKIAIQKEELSDCAQKENFRIYGELIKANIHAIPRSATSVTVVNYYDENCAEIKIPLDCKLSPASNSQRYFKKYAKLKNAEVELKKQIALAEKELEYIYTVFDSLSKAEEEADIVQIRCELYESGYGSKMKNASLKKIPKTKPLKFRTSGGFEVLAGKNNTQNDILTHKTAEKHDWFFHVKGAAGSHVIMFTNEKEPGVDDFTECAEIAAYYSSKRGGDNIDVDYTLVKNVKKPSGSKPGFVVYSSNYSATVSPTEAKIKSLIQ